MNKEEIEKIKETLSNFEYFVDDDFGGHYENIDFSQKALTPISILSIIEYIEDLQHQLEERDKKYAKIRDEIYDYLDSDRFCENFENVCSEKNVRERIFEILERGKNGKKVN